MDRTLVDSIKQQSEDLREELKELEQWEEEMSNKKRSRAAAAGGADDADAIIPIRGTVPSLQDAMQEQLKKRGAAAPSAANDPVVIAKERGNEYFKCGNMSDAIHSYTTGIELDPQGPSAHILYANRAMCYLKQSQWTAAESDANAAVKLDKSYAKGYFRRAVARKNLGRLKEARSDLESVLALVPSDAGAQTELEVVTKMLQEERAKTQQGSAPAKKKIAIVEVEDDDEEEEEGQTDGDAAKDSATANTAVPDVEVDEAREKRVKAQMEALEQARKEEAAKRLQKQREEEKQLLQRQRQRSNNKVEVIEEVEDAEPTTAPAAASTASAAAAAAAAAAPAQPQTETPKHADPTAAAPTSAATPSREPQPQQPEKASPSAAAPSASASRSAGRTSVEVTHRPHLKPTKETLTPPKSFTEFERVFGGIKGDAELSQYYLGLLKPASLASLFGSNLEPELLVDILKGLANAPAAEAFEYLKGLSKVNRIGDMTLFFDAGEKKLITNLLESAKSAGVPDADISAVKKKLQM